MALVLIFIYPIFLVGQAYEAMSGYVKSAYLYKRDQMMPTTTFFGSNCRLSICANVTYKIKKKSKFYVASCPELNLIGKGNTKASATENLKDIVKKFLIESYENNSLKTDLERIYLVTAGRQMEHMITVDVRLV